MIMVAESGGVRYCSPLAVIGSSRFMRFSGRHYTIILQPQQHKVENQNKNTLIILLLQLTTQHRRLCGQNKLPPKRGGSVNGSRKALSKSKTKMGGCMFCS